MRKTLALLVVVVFFAFASFPPDAHAADTADNAGSAPVIIAIVVLLGCAVYLVTKVAPKTQHSYNREPAEFQLEKKATGREALSASSPSSTAGKPTVLSSLPMTIGFSF